MRNLYLRNKAKKLIQKKEKELAANLSKNTFRDKESEYIDSLMTGNELTGNMLYDWDARDGNPEHNG